LMIVQAGFCADYNTVELGTGEAAPGGSKNGEVSGQQSAGDSAQDGALPIALGEEITDFLEKEVVPILSSALFEKRGLEALPRNLLESFQNQIGVTPCHPHLLSDSVSKLFDAWFNKGQLKPYMKMYEDYLAHVSNNFPDLKSRADSASVKLKDFVKRAVQEEERRGMGAVQSSPQVSIPETIGFEERLLAYQIDFLKSSKTALSESTVLLFYLDEILRVLKDPKKVFDQCRENLECILGEGKVERSMKVKKLFDRTKVWYLGYSEADLGEYERIIAEYPVLFSSDRRLHKARIVARPEDPQARTNEYRQDIELVWMWSVELLSEDIQSRTEEFRPYCPGIESEKIKAALLEERVKIFIHEMGHTVSSKLLRDGKGDWNKLGKEWSEIGWVSEQKQKGAPFDCAEVSFNKLAPKSSCEVNFLKLTPGDLIYQKYVFLTQYAGVNPEEDFAETFAHVMTGNPVFLGESLHPAMSQRVQFIQSHILGKMLD